MKINRKDKIINEDVLETVTEAKLQLQEKKLLNKCHHMQGIC
jgi:hypothetical protein